MPINLICPTEIPSGVLIADTIGIDSIPTMTTVIAGGITKTVSSALEIQSTLGGLLLPRLTTTERNALTTVPGMQIYNISKGSIELFDNTSSWVSPGSGGGVTSIDVITSGVGVTFTGGPITGSGNITATLDTSLQNLTQVVTQGLMVKNGNNILTRSLSTANASNITISDPDGVTGSPTFNLATTGATPGSYTQADITVDAFGRITEVASGGGGSGAPSDGTYILQTPSAFLPDAQSLSALSSGIMKSTTATGVVSIAVPGTDYYSLGHPTRIIDDGFANGNFFIGSGAGNLTYVTAEFNTGVGQNSLNAINNGIQNTFIGHDSGLKIQDGNFNTGCGQLSLSSIVNNNSCTALGFNAASALVTGGTIVAIGSNSMSAATSATDVTLVGANTSITNGISNSGAFGFNASVSVSNAINLGNGCLIGLNKPTPLYTLDMGLVGGIAAIHYPDSSLPSTPSSGVILYSNSGALNYMASDGIPHAFTAGTVTSITAGTGLSGGTITSSGTIAIATTGVTANPYTVGNFTVNAQGQLTSASSATIINDTHFSAGTDNLIIGFNSQINLSGVANSTSVGNFAGLNLASGASNNTFIGVEAGRNVTTAVNCVAVGTEALVSNTVQDEIIAIGTGAMQSLSGGAPGTRNGHVAVGKSAGFSINGGTTSTFIGRMAGNSLLSSTDSVFLGHLSGNNMTGGDTCTFIGANTTSSNNSLTNAGCLGAGSSINVSNAINLGSGCLVGINNPSPLYALDMATIGGKAAIHYPDSTLPPTPSSGVIIYSNSGVPTYMASDGVPHAFDTNPGTVTSITAGTGLSGGTITSSGTIAIASTAVTAASYTVGNFTVNAQGQLTAASSASKITDDVFHSSLYIGFGQNPNASTLSVNETLTIGSQALVNATSSSARNMAIGNGSLTTLTSGTDNMAIGASALNNADTSSLNMAIGLGTLFHLAGSGSTSNTAVGYQCANPLPSGTLNTFLGYQPGFALNATSSNNTIIGANSIASVHSLSSCTFIGEGADSTVVTGLTNSGAFGAGTIVSSSNSINLGNGCNVGLNNPSPVYNLDIANISNINATNQAVGSVVPSSSTNGYVTYTYTAFTFNTTNLNLPILTLGIGSSATVEVLISGATSTQSDFTGGSCIAGVIRAGGNISLVGTTNNIIATSTGTFSLSVDTGTQSVILNATGIASSTYDWVITVKYIIA